MNADSASPVRSIDDVLPSDVAVLQRASGAPERDEAWARVIAEFTPLILRVAHATLTERDDAMDAYAFVLDVLREDDFRRIRAYGADGRCKFSTWLVVVARRACIDFARSKYGRRVPQAAASDEATTRRRLAAKLRDAEDVELLVDDWRTRPDGRLRTKELTTLLDASVGELSADDQHLLKLRFDDDLPAREIALVTGAPSPFHVYRRLNALLALLRRRLTSLGVDGSVP